jgi:uncharacterized protein YbjQ (UPF0145 family)
MITAMTDATPAVINFLVSSLVSIMLTGAAVLAQLCVCSAVRGLRSVYQQRVAEHERTLEREADDRLRRTQSVNRALREIKQRVEVREIKYFSRGGGV